MSPLPRFLVLAPALSCALCACSGDAQLSSRFASDFAHAPHTLAVLGVYKDGRMSSEAWEAVGPGLSRPFGATCDTGFAQLEAKNQPLSGAIDDYTRANGVGDDLLEQLAPAAQGDLILVVTVAGHVGTKGPNLPDTSTMSSGTPGIGSSKYRTGSSIGSPMDMFTLSQTLASLSVSAYPPVLSSSGPGVMAVGQATVSFPSVFPHQAVQLGVKSSYVSLNESFYQLTNPRGAFAPVVQTMPGRTLLSLDY